MANCLNIAKMRRNVGRVYTLKKVRYKAFCKSLSCSKMHFNGYFMSRGVKMDVCGLDHSGSQPFIYHTPYNSLTHTFTSVKPERETCLSARYKSYLSIIMLLSKTCNMTFVEHKSCNSVREPCKCETL